MMTEADTCREFVTPRLTETGWATEPHAIGEQRTSAGGHIMVSEGKARCGIQERADYVCRVASNEGVSGLTCLGHFQDVDQPAPVILATSQLLTTGIDAEIVKNMALARVAGSRSEFKQIIGCGCWLKVDYGKEYLNLIDFAGAATQHFADSGFDGEPARLEEAAIDDDGEVVAAIIEENPTVTESGPSELAEDEIDDGGVEDPSPSALQSAWVCDS